MTHPPLNQSKTGCTIEWNVLSLDEWQTRFNQTPYSNILQSYQYAQAMAVTDRQKARWGLVKINGVEAGLVQILEAGILWNLFHAVILDRGPLWFRGFGGAAHIKLFFDAFNQVFPKRFGRKRRIIPEIESGATAQALIKQTGLMPKAEEKAYQTLWWNLEVEPLLRPNWSGSLKKAEKMINSGEIIIEWDDKGIFYSDLRCKYALDKQLRGYGGPSPKFLDNIARFSTKDNPMIIGKVSKGSKLIAMMMFLKHGQSATYQVGWSSDTGRKCCAHHLLLWQGRSVLQGYGVKQLDLGGINDENDGIKKFKEGTGAKPCALLGFYT